MTGNRTAFKYGASIARQGMEGKAVMNLPHDDPKERTPIILTRKELDAERVPTLARAALEQARTAATFLKSTAALYDRAEENPSFSSDDQPSRSTVWGGGVAVFHEGVCVGGTACRERRTD